MSASSSDPDENCENGLEGGYDLDALSDSVTTHLAELIREGEAKPSEILEAAIARCEERNPKLNAVVIPMLDEARTEIAQLSAELDQYRQVAAIEEESRNAADPARESSSLFAFHVTPKARSR